MSLPNFIYGYKGSYGVIPNSVGPYFPFTYEITIPPVELPLTLAEVKIHLKIDNNDEDTYLTFLITAVRDFFESYTDRILVDTTFETFRHFFNSFFYIKRAKLQSIISIEYLKDTVLTVIDSAIYYFTKRKTFSSILLNEGESWPQDGDSRLDSIKIVFVAGFGPTADSIPADIKLALLNHIADMYENRGDCQGCGCYFPPQTKLIYNAYRIRDFAVNSQLG